jgi:hypothetical protein
LTGGRETVIAIAVPFSDLASDLVSGLASTFVSGFGSWLGTGGGVDPPARFRYSSRLIGCSAIQFCLRKLSASVSASENGNPAPSATSDSARWPSKVSSSFHCGACRRMEGISRS